MSLPWDISFEIVKGYLYKESGIKSVDVMLNVGTDEYTNSRIIRIQKGIVASYNSTHIPCSLL